MQTEQDRIKLIASTPKIFNKIIKIIEFYLYWPWPILCLWPVTFHHCRSHDGLVRQVVHPIKKLKHKFYNSSIQQKRKIIFTGLLQNRDIYHNTDTFWILYFCFSSQIISNVSTLSIGSFLFVSFIFLSFFVFIFNLKLFNTVYDIYL